MKQPVLLILLLLAFTTLAFVCNSTKMTIPSSRVNDGYCDCEDGSDEWETYVCNQNIFICKQEIGKDGYRINKLITYRNWRVLSSMFVNDGLCDCCDCSYTLSCSCQSRDEPDSISSQWINECDQRNIATIAYLQSVYDEQV